MDYRERGSHAVYLAHGNSKGEEEEEIDKNNERVVRNLEEKNVSTKGKSPKQDLTSAKDLTIERHRIKSGIVCVYFYLLKSLKHFLNTQKININVVQ